MLEYKLYFADRRDAETALELLSDAAADGVIENDFEVTFVQVHDEPDWD